MALKIDTIGRIVPQLVNDPDELVGALQFPDGGGAVFSADAQKPDAVLVDKLDLVLPRDALQSGEGTRCHAESHELRGLRRILGNADIWDARRLGQKAQHIAQQGTIESEALGRHAAQLRCPAVALLAVVESVYRTSNGDQRLVLNARRWGGKGSIAGAQGWSRLRGGRQRPGRRRRRQLLRLEQRCSGAGR